MRMRIESDRWKGLGAVQVMIVAAVVLSLAGAGIAAEGDKAPKADGKKAGNAKAATMALAPTKTMYVFHLDVAGMRKTLVPAIEKNKKALAGMPIDPAMELMKKVDAVNFYIVSGANSVFLAIRGTIGADDITKFSKLIAGPDAAPTKGKNGRYSMLESLVIIGDEASDVPQGVVLIGAARGFSDKIIASLGKGDNTKLTKLLAKVDTAANVWFAIDFSGESDKNTPASAYGSANLTGKNPIDVTIVCRDKEQADKIAGDLANAPKFWQAMVTLKKDGLNVKVTMSGRGDLIDKVMKNLPLLIQTGVDGPE